MAIFNELERRQQLRLSRDEARFLRDRSDPFSLTNQRFIDIFRLNKELVMFLFEELQPTMQDNIRASRIQYQQRILVALRFFATGNYQRGVGQEYLLGVSQPVVSRCVAEVSQKIVEYFSPNWIKFPDEHEMLGIKTAFFDICGIPGVVGAIDCTHIAILTPIEEEHSFMNRKGYHSLNVQLICDVELFINNVNSRFPGGNHDALIWRQSLVQDFLRNNFENGERNTWLLGDSGYPQQPWLMTPVQGALPNSPEERYNNAHVLGRNPIERVNGVLKTRFRCSLGERVLRYSPQKTGAITNCCCILHNMCTRARIPFDEPIVANEDIEIENVPVYYALDRGRQIRENLINTYFTV